MRDPDPVAIDAATVSREASRQVALGKLPACQLPSAENWIRRINPASIASVVSLALVLGSGQLGT